MDNDGCGCFGCLGNVIMIGMFVVMILGLVVGLMIGFLAR